jgi:hypothetical protein
MEKENKVSGVKQNKELQYYILGQERVHTDAIA